MTHSVGLYDNLISASYRPINKSIQFNANVKQEIVRFQ